MKIIRKLIDKYKLIICISIIACLIIHLPLITKNIFSADILLNTGYYQGYAWEISLGRFGLYIIGIIKNFLVMKELETIISIIILTASLILILDLFKIKSKSLQIIGTLIAISSPIASATLLFHYCSLAYFLAFFCSTLAIYLFVRTKHFLFKFIIPILLIAFSLSCYQAYLSLPITCILIYFIIKLLTKEFTLKEGFTSLIIIIGGVVVYYILMNLSLFIFNIDLSTYQNANTFGLNNLLSLKDGLINSYQVFYDFYFTDTITTNSNLLLIFLNISIFIILFISLILEIIKRNLKPKDIILLSICILILPIAINIITLIMPSTNMQLLMSTSYLLIFFLICYLVQNNKVLKVAAIIVFVLLIRGYVIEDNATYQTLSLTYQKTYQIAADINEKIKEYGFDKQIMIAGNLSDNSYYNARFKTELINIFKLNYGFISNYSLFWNEYSNMKNGWARFMELFFGTPLNFVDNKTYQEILNSKEYNTMESYPDKESIKVINDIIVIKF